MSTLLIVLQFLLHLPLLYTIPEVLLIPHLLTLLDGLQYVLHFLKNVGNSAPVAYVAV